MKLTHALILFTCLALPAAAVDMESFSFRSHLLSLRTAKAPEVLEREKVVLFTATDRNEHIGIAFKNEGFATVHWFKKLMLRSEVMDMPLPSTLGKKGFFEKKAPPLPTTREAGVQFFVYDYPKGSSELEYRLIIDGLWTTDPWNSRTRKDNTTGLTVSLVSLPSPTAVDLQADEPGTVHFNFGTKGDIPSGETITVAGSFNGWDPFMYELTEQAPGFYTLDLNLPPGTYQYAFYWKGKRLLDPANHHTVYTREGKSASELTVQ